MGKRVGYGGYALAILLISIAIDGVLFSMGYRDLLILLSLPLVFLGLHAVFFSVFTTDWKYYLIWGLIMSCLGFSLFLTLFTGNIMLNLSISLIIIVVVGVVISRVSKY